MQSYASYVIDLFHALYGLRERIPIGYGDAHDAETRLRIRQSAGDYFDQRIALDINKIHWKTWRGQAIPLLFDDHDGPIISDSNGTVEIEYDLIASSFFLLSGWQELVSPERDQYGRYPFSESLQSKLGVHAVPLVNYYLDIIWTAARRAYRLPQEPLPLWTKSAFATMLSHDIDKLTSGWMEGAVHALRKHQVGQAARYAIGRIGRPDPWFNIDEILDIERELGVNSTFFFLTTEGRFGSIDGADYDVSSVVIQELLPKIRKAGSEVAVHGSSDAHLRSETMELNLRRLNQDVVGNRFHYLQFDMASTVAILEAQGLVYDATLGFAEQVGFRNGCCTPFFLFNHQRNQGTSVVEVPLTVMDTTLDKYLGLKPAQALKAVESVLSETRKFGGCFNLLWHNNYFSDAKYAGWDNVYRQIVQRCKEMGSAFLTGREIAESFRRRNPQSN